MTHVEYLFLLGMDVVLTTGARGYSRSDIGYVIDIRHDHKVVNVRFDDEDALHTVSFALKYARSSRSRHVIGPEHTS